MVGDLTFKAYNKRIEREEQLEKEIEKLVQQKIPEQEPFEV